MRRSAAVHAMQVTAGQAAWGTRTPHLIAMLADKAPQLRSLELWYPELASRNPASALPAALGQLRQLTSLTLDLGCAPVTAAQVDAVLQTLPLLQHLALDAIQGETHLA